MKKYLLAGLMVLLPITLTLWLLIYLIDLFTGPFLGLSRSIVLTWGIDVARHDMLILVLSRIIALVVVFLLVLLLGVLGRKVFFNFFLRLADKLFLKIPVVSPIYRLFQDITKAVFSQKEKSFKQTVLVPFPSESTHAVGFVTGEAPQEIKKNIPEADVAVFVPTAPYPLSGFMLLASKKAILSTEISVEEGFKFLLSCGAFEPVKKQ